MIGKTLTFKGDIVETFEERKKKAEKFLDDMDLRITSIRNVNHDSAGTVKVCFELKSILSKYVSDVYACEYEKDRKRQEDNDADRRHDEDKY